MAKRLFDEEKIRAIAATLQYRLKTTRGFTTAEMPQAIERLYETSRLSGLNDGYQAGYADGYRKGLDTTAKNSYDEGYTEGYDKGVDDGGNSYDKGFADGVNTGTNSGYSEGYSTGYSKGSSDGAEALKRIEARSADDILLFESTLAIPSGYYAERIEQELDTSHIFNDGRSAGYSDGYGMGYDIGYAKGLDDGTGVILPPLTNPGTASDLIQGTELIDGDGNIVKGTLAPKSSYDIIIDDANLVILIPSGVYRKGTAVDTTHHYNMGYEAGKDSMALPQLTNPGTADDLLFGKQLIDSERNIVEGTIYTRSGDDVGLIGLDVTIPEGYYPEKVEKTIDGGRIYMEGHSVGYQTGYSDGYTAGVSSVETYEDGNGVYY